jgi:hypothetical protein
MIATATETARADGEAQTAKSELQHWYCDCSKPVMLCGVVDTSHECPDDLSCGCLPCLVCDDLVDVPCERCGE